MVLPPSLSELLADIVAKTIVAIAKDIDVIWSAVQRAQVSTLTDSKPDPVLNAELQQEQSAAVASGQLPPADVR